MMYEVKVFEKSRMVHSSVRPIEIGVMQKNHEDNAQSPISPTSICDGIVSQGVFSYGRSKDQQTNKRENEDGRKGIQSFSLHIFPSGEFLLNLSEAPFVSL